LEKVLQKIMVGLFLQLEIPNSESNSSYIQLCKAVSTPVHPARFQKLQNFLSNFNRARKKVLDIFAGSNTTGAAAEAAKRYWIAFEQNPLYLASSAFRFVDKNQSLDDTSLLFKKLTMLQEPVHISQAAQLSLDIEGVDFIGRLLCATYSCSWVYEFTFF